MDVSRKWRRWATFSLLSGVPVSVVVDGLVKHTKLDDVAAARFCGELQHDPMFQAAQWVQQQRDKLESVLAMRQQMRALSSRPFEIERRSGVSRDEFLEEYYAQNRPVILLDVCSRWPASQRWTPEYLLEVLGDAKVSVMDERLSDPDYEMNCDAHIRKIPFRRYYDMVMAGRGNNTYMTANNEVLSTKVARPLWDDLVEDERYLEPDDDRAWVYLWFGSAGTVTPFHHDAVNVLFNQIYGEKRFTLVSPLESHCMYNLVSVYSKVDALAPDLERYPKFAEAHPVQFVIRPGETLFVPAGWWHHVVSLSTSISVSCTRFAWTNSIDWVDPDIELPTAV